MTEMMLSDKRAAMMMMARKQGAPRLTRTMRRVWERGINFSGTKEEWYEEGRKTAVEFEQDQRVNGRIKSIIRDMDQGGAWVAIG